MSWRAICLVLLLAAAGDVAADSDARTAAAWKDNYVARLQALAALQSLNADLLSHDSATLTLDRWCASHRLASPARIVADRVQGVEKAPTDEQRQILGVSATEPVRYRHVRLRCGEHVLSEAENWYVPSRLTAEMNQTLVNSDTSFGRVVASLNFRRQTLDAKLLWSPLPEGWDMGTSLPRSKSRTLLVPEQVLQHRAVLRTPDGTAFSQLIETYTSKVLAFPQPAH
jgi:chorismate-pyruvate lyase